MLDQQRKRSVETLSTFSKRVGDRLALHERKMASKTRNISRIADESHRKEIIELQKHAYDLQRATKNLSVLMGVLKTPNTTEYDKVIGLTAKASNFGNRVGMYNLLEVPYKGSYKGLNKLKNTNSDYKFLEKYNIGRPLTQPL